MADYSKSSPYYDTSSYGNFLDVMNKRTFPMLADDVQVTLTEAYRNRPDLLAYDIYGNPKLWWVFMQRNVDIIFDPIYDFRSGVTIALPKKSQLLALLGLS